MATLPTLITVDAFDEFLARPENRERLFELIDGEIVEKMPTEEHGEVAAVFVIEFGIYFRANPIGRVGVEVRHQMPDDPSNAFLPDVSVHLDRTRPRVRQGAVPRMPDLAVEIKSPDDTFKEMRDQAAYYLAHGTQLVWLVYPEQRIVEVYAPDADSQLLTERDTLTGGDLLPGFALPMSRVFEF
jgi:Uma2 family endonuclease